MSDVALGRFNRWIEKFFNAKGGPTTVDVAATVQPILGLDRGIDHRYLEGWNRFAITATVLAVAANFGRIRIRNPVASNVIIVLEQLYVFSTLVDQPIATYGATITDLASVLPLTFSRLDPRGNPQPTAIVSQNAQASGGTVFLQRVLAANSNADFIQNPNQEIPILPGNVLDLQSNIANQNFFGGLMWRERALESSELT